MEKVSTDKNKIESLLERRVDKDGSFPSKEMVISKLLEGGKLRFYLGIDPTGPQIHLGHTVQLLLLKGLADLGHEVIVLMGDFTARIGDPTGKDSTRKPLTKEEIKDHMDTYEDQISRIIPKDLFNIKHNADWLAKMSFEDVIKLSSNFTVQQMIVRDMFQERLKNEKPIGVHEFLYPLMQGYDSVAMEVDGEIGGHDQIFNMLVGRDLVKKYLNKDKIVLAGRLLVDSKTGKKMSKTEGELIAISDEPREIRRKILAIDDNMIKTVFELCTEEDQDLINKDHDRLSPREFKELLSDKLINIYYPGENKSDEALKPKEILLSNIEGSAELPGIVKGFGFASSMSEAKNLISGGAVEVNGKTETNWNYEPKKGDSIKVGKGKFGLIK